MLRAWKYVRERPKLLATVLAKTPPTVANSGAWVTLNLVAGQRLSFTTLAIAVGIMQSVRAIGSGIGPCCPRGFSRTIPSWEPWSRLRGMLLLAASESPWVSMVALALWGIGQGHNWVLSAANLQAGTPDHLLGRVTSIDFFLFSVGGAFAAMLAGYLCDVWGHPGAGTVVTVGIGGMIWLVCQWLLGRGAVHRRIRVFPPREVWTGDGFVGDPRGDRKRRLGMRTTMGIVGWLVAGLVFGCDSEEEYRRG